MKYADEKDLNGEQNVTYSGSAYERQKMHVHCDYLYPFRMNLHCTDSLGLVLFLDMENRKNRIDVYIPDEKCNSFMELMLSIGVSGRWKITNVIIQKSLDVLLKQAVAFSDPAIIATSHLIDKTITHHGNRKIHLITK